MLKQLEMNVRAALRRGAISAAGGLMIFTGIGFLTVALLIALSIFMGALFAFLIVGLVLVGLGLIILSTGARTPHHPLEQPPTPPASDLRTTLIGAFVDGMRAGQSVRRR